MSELGDFLRQHRAAVRPADVGMEPSLARRRVAGLRREELALLTGISVDYYARLEQGRVLTASPEVLDALAGALCLDAGERTLLYRLADR
ncbi:helix-turn-helix transcriptional regulator [Streptomyces sp. NPDC006458]|uniref:helix-turn-helix domain-containing protein n=1 Tax=Streptomyces sp. NPDC006458 TaxID=3154302 RepID=UPI0033A19A28